MDSFLTPYFYGQPMGGCLLMNVSLQTDIDVLAYKEIERMKLTCNVQTWTANCLTI